MFGKVKQFFGFVGIDVTLDINTSIPSTVNQIEGKVVVTAKAKQHITAVRVRMYESYERGSGDDRRTETRDLGKWEVNDPFDIDDGEFREFPFTLIFERSAAMGPETGLLNAVVGFFGADSDFFVSAVVDVKGAALDPTKTHEVFFT